MEKNTVTTLKGLKQGDRFYILFDPKKIVYERLDFDPVYKISGNPYWVCPVSVMEDSAMDKRRKAHYYEALPPDTDVFYLDNVND